MNVRIVVIVKSFDLTILRRFTADGGQLNLHFLHFSRACELQNRQNLPKYLVVSDFFRIFAKDIKVEA